MEHLVTRWNAVPVGAPTALVHCYELEGPKAHNSDPLIGVRIRDTYEIVRKLGAGGFGSVYLAKDIDLGKKVAIKVFLDEHADKPDLIDRFQNEARAVAALREEWSGYSDTCNLVDVLGMGRLDSGAPYTILEFLRGEDLHAWLNNRRKQQALPSLEEALTILAQICCGLEAVHQARIVHRDLKPGNIFITPTLTSPLHLKILDFGIAKLSASEVATTGNTVEGRFMGSLSYSAPEQARSMATVDQRADIFSLGVIAYQLLTLRAPYNAETLYAVGANEKQIRSPREYRPDIPEAWAALVMSMLSHEPSNRPQSTLSVAHRLGKTFPGGEGMKLVAKVAPLLTTPAWIQRTRKVIAIPLPVKGDTITVDSTGFSIETTAPRATPVMPPFLEAPTTLASAASEAIATPVLPTPLGTGRQWRLPLLVAGLLATGVFALLWIVASSDTAPTNQHNRAVATTPAPDAGVPRPDAATGRAETPRSVDAGVRASTPDAAPPTRVDSVRAEPKKRERTGKLRVTTVPWATVYVDGQRKGTTPITVRVRTGSRRVVVENKALGKRETIRIKVEAGKTKSVHRAWQ